MKLFRTPIFVITLTVIAVISIVTVAYVATRSLAPNDSSAAGPSGACTPGQVTCYGQQKYMCTNSAGSYQLMSPATDPQDCGAGVALGTTQCRTDGYRYTCVAIDCGGNGWRAGTAPDPTCAPTTSTGSSTTGGGTTGGTANRVNGDACTYGQSDPATGGCDGDGPLQCLICTAPSGYRFAKEGQSICMGPTSAEQNAACGTLTAIASSASNLCTDNGGTCRNVNNCSDIDLSSGAGICTGGLKCCGSALPQASTSAAASDDGSNNPSTNRYCANQPGNNICDGKLKGSTQTANCQCLAANATSDICACQGLHTGSIGDLCVGNDSCKSGLVCKDTGDNLTCQQPASISDGGIPNPGTKPEFNKGETCSISVECLNGYFCNKDKKCEVLHAVGGYCTATSQCKGGLSCNSSKNICEQQLTFTGLINLIAQLPFVEDNFFTDLIDFWIQEVGDKIGGSLVYRPLPPKGGGQTTSSGTITTRSSSQATQSATTSSPNQHNVTDFTGEACTRIGELLCVTPTGEIEDLRSVICDTNPITSELEYRFVYPISWQYATCVRNSDLNPIHPLSERDAYPPAGNCVFMPVGSRACAYMATITDYDNETATVTGSISSDFTTVICRGGESYEPAPINFPCQPADNFDLPEIPSGSSCAEVDNVDYYCNQNDGFVHRCNATSSSNPDAIVPGSQCDESFIGN